MANLTICLLTVSETETTACTVWYCCLRTKNPSFPGGGRVGRRERGEGLHTCSSLGVDPGSDQHSLPHHPRRQFPNSRPHTT